MTRQSWDSQMIDGVFPSKAVDIGSLANTVIVSTTDVDNNGDHIEAVIARADWEDDTFVSHDDPDHALPVYARALFTLDDLTRRINEICSENVETARAAKLQFDMSLEALARAIDASPDLDKHTAALAIVTRVNRMVSELSGAVG